MWAAVGQPQAFPGLALPPPLVASRAARLLPLGWLPPAPHQPTFQTHVSLVCVTRPVMLTYNKQCATVAHRGCCASCHIIASLWERSSLASLSLSLVLFLFLSLLASAFDAMPHLRRRRDFALQRTVPFYSCPLFCDACYGRTMWGCKHNAIVPSACRLVLSLLRGLPVPPLLVLKT